MFEVNTFDPKTLSWWNDEKDNIDFDPPYQRRGYVWSGTDKQYLIDSILNGYDIPKLYIADFSFGNSSLNQSGKQYAVIDGKQRFRAIFEFFDGSLVLANNFVWARDPSLRVGGLSYKDLQKNYPKDASKFANASLTVMRVITDEEAKINELFVRLNKGKTLSGAEVRNAMGGIVPQLIRGIAAHRFFTEVIAFATTRRQSDNVAAKLLLLEFRGTLLDTKKVHLDRFVAEGLSAEARADEFRQAQQRVLQFLNRMTEVFTARDPLLRSQGPVTLYYWLVRATEPQALARLREFLVAFDKLRKNNKRLSRNNPEQADPELLKFDVLDRSTNDQGSLEQRFNILRHRLAAWTP
jgi:hypothetical protein